MNAPLRSAVPTVPLLMAAFLAMPGCSNDSPASATGRSGIDLTAVRACELITPAEIEAASGFAVDVGQDRSELDGRLPMCFWPRTGSESSYAANVLVTTSSYTDYEQYMRLTGGDVASGEVPDLGKVRPVDGVGRFGVWLEDLGMLQVYGDTVMLQVDVDVADERDEMEAAKTLAEAALVRLP